MSIPDPDNVEILGGILGELDLFGDEEVLGGPFDFIADAGKAIGKVATKIVKSPITKMVAGGLAIVYPPVGIPLTAGLVIADRVMSVAEGSRGSPKQQVEARKILAHTHRLATAAVKLARLGKPVPHDLVNAHRFIEHVAAAKKVRRALAKKAGTRSEPLVTVDRKGRIRRGHYVRV